MPSTVLARSRGGVLRQLDKLVRRGVRQWLRLPHDATNAYMHAEVKDGGLGIPSLRATIPFMKRDRLERLATSSVPMISHMVANSGTFARECASCSRPPVRVGSTVVTSRDEARRVRAEQLHLLVGAVSRGPVHSLLGIGRNCTHDRRRLHPRRTDKGRNCQHPAKICPG